MTIAEQLGEAVERCLRAAPGFVYGLADDVYVSVNSHGSFKIQYDPSGPKDQKLWKQLKEAAIRLSASGSVGFLTPVFSPWELYFMPPKQ